MKPLAAIISLTPLSLAYTSAPDGCISVAMDGSATYSSIQDAVYSLPTSDSSDQCIFIGAGAYSEQVLVESRSAALTIYGYTEDDSTYSSNQVTITSSLSQADGLTNDETATLRVKAANFKLYNVNVANGYGQGSQAVALSAYDDSGYYGCSFTGFQDTVLAQEGYQFYAKCLVEGATDFIFGQYAAAWFERCDIRVLEASVGYVTANGRTESDGPSYYVFNNCDVEAADGASVSSGAYYLGRPWREYARVVFQNSALSSVISGEGWSVWNEGDERTDGVVFGEHANSGNGASGTRASFATSLSAAVDVTEILGSDYASSGYMDTDFL
ncbi:hypothetical protein MKZ38_005735 [Zalerion maritima]|uniref:Pectinesterase n=1 Tax=Zalerion maritima TaxID=339359 RepID=A0AAD5RKD6_9PEZI|nr:hypothetical protein MKZ38_005735 [Zalerion maritima]